MKEEKKIVNFLIPFRMDHILKQKGEIFSKK